MSQAAKILKKHLQYKRTHQRENEGERAEERKIREEGEKKEEVKRQKKMEKRRLEADKKAKSEIEDRKKSEEDVHRSNPTTTNIRHWQQCRI
jgi:hypothetical protein